MRVVFDDDEYLYGMFRRCWLEGASCAFSGSDLQEGDIHIQAPTKMPDVFLEGLGYKFYPKNDVTHAFARIWTPNKKWLDHNVLICPIRGLMSNRRGANIVVGCGTRFIPTCDDMEYFLHPQIESFLSDTERTKIVTIAFDHDKPVTVMMGLPFYAQYSLMENVDGKVVDWYKDPYPLHESWSVANVVSRAPWPFSRTHKEAAISGLTQDLERHFWPFCAGEQIPHTGVWRTSKTLIGVATAWGEKQLSHAIDYVNETTDRIVCNEIQFRTDLLEGITDSLIVARSAFVPFGGPNAV